MADEGFKNVTYESEKNVNNYFYSVEFDEKGNPRITIIAIAPDDEAGNHVYESYANFYDIEEDVAAGSRYVSFKFKTLNETGSEEEGVLRFSNVTDNEDITLRLTVPEEQQNREIILKKVK